MPSQLQSQLRPAGFIYKMSGHAFFSAHVLRKSPSLLRGLPIRRFRAQPKANAGRARIIERSPCRPTRWRRLWTPHNEAARTGINTEFHKGEHKEFHKGETSYDQSAGTTGCASGVFYSVTNTFKVAGRNIILSDKFPQVYFSVHKATGFGPDCAKVAPHAS
jgi:hypothetical protein